MNYLEGVTVLVHTLNNEEDIKDLLESILTCAPNQIIVADGSSSDRTVEFSKNYNVETVVTPPGFHHQQKAALELVRFKYLLIVEPDHRFKENFIKEFMKEYLNSPFDGLQATLICDLKSNFWEKGISSFYRIHQRKKGKKEIIGGPALYHTELRKKHLIPSENGYSNDTANAEKAKNLKITFGLGHTECIQHQKIDKNIFLKKYYNYGVGDYHFYCSHQKNWTLIRKIQSLLHVPKRHMFHYPAICIAQLDIVGASYIFLSGLLRTSIFYFNLIRNKK